jgi:hypothetical protein
LFDQLDRTLAGFSRAETTYFHQLSGIEPPQE